jgi:hypothetical protein
MGNEMFNSCRTTWKERWREHNHGLDQDRLVKELRLSGISTIEQSGRFLLETYPPKMNGKFARPAVSRGTARASLLDVNLTGIFCFILSKKEADRPASDAA